MTHLTGEEAGRLYDTYLSDLDCVKTEQFVEELLTARLAEQAEQIAQAIEARRRPSPDRGSPGRLECAVYDDAARVARGWSCGGKR